MSKVLYEAEYKSGFINGLAKMLTENCRFDMKESSIIARYFPCANFKENLLEITGYNYSQLTKVSIENSLNDLLLKWVKCHNYNFNDTNGTITFNKLHNNSIKAVEYFVKLVQDNYGESYNIFKLELKSIDNNGEEYDEFLYSSSSEKNGWGCFYITESIVFLEFTNSYIMLMIGNDTQ